MNKWESIPCKDYGPYPIWMTRLNVPGGWIVNICDDVAGSVSEEARALTTTFIPDANHEWDISE